MSSLLARVQRCGVSPRVGRRLLSGSSNSSHGGRDDAWTFKVVGLPCLLATVYVASGDPGYEILRGGGTWREKSSRIFANQADAVTKYVLRWLPAEGAHLVAVKAMALGLGPVDRQEDDSILATRVLGLNFPNVVGLAAGFDKEGEAVNGLLDSGFGFVEVGSVTPQPQPGNAKPRMFRLREDRAIINRCGFNSGGLTAVEANMASTASETRSRKGLVGINVGKNKTTSEEDAANDFAAGIATLAPYADYVVVNVSSPNTPGLRALQRKEMLATIINAAVDARDVAVQMASRRPLPLFVKIAPDLTSDEKKDIAELVLTGKRKVDGLIISNTTVARPAFLTSENKAEVGGLSGAPLKTLSTKVLGEMYLLTRGQVPIVAVGGIDSGKEAYERIKCGASLVQVYSALVYEGPGLVVKIKRELAELLKADGYSSVSEAVGSRWNQEKKA